MSTSSTRPITTLSKRDILYVEPNLAMAQDASIGTTRSLWGRGIQIILNLGSLLYRVQRYYCPCARVFEVVLTVDILCSKDFISRLILTN